MKLILKARVARTRSYLPSDADHPYGRSIETTITGDVEVTIDETKIANWYGCNALRNKTGRAQTLNGMVKARVIRRDPPVEVER